jgi:hypothetical protein
VSLSKEPVFSELKNHYVVGYRNIMGEPYAGNSGTHKPNGNAVDTTNGAGPHNIQMFVMNPDGTVVHCLPGFWNANDLVHELELARKLNDVYMNRELSPELKAKQFAALQRDHVRFHSAEMQARSHLQGFDMKAEAHKPNSDCIKDRSLLGEEWGPGSCEAFKTTDVIMHERMASRPFKSYSQFDVAKFSDYGTDFYDKHEDALDENGHMVAAEEGGMKVEPIKNARSIQSAAARAASAGGTCNNGMCPAPATQALVPRGKKHHAHAAAPHAPIVPKTYVKTYGSVNPAKKFSGGVGL